MDSKERIYGKFEAIFGILDQIKEDVPKCIWDYETSLLGHEHVEIVEKIKAYKMAIEKQSLKHNVK